MTVEALAMDFYGTLVHEDDAVIASICDAGGASATASRPAPADITARWSAAFQRASENAFGDAIESQRRHGRNTPR